MHSGEEDELQPFPEAIAAEVRRPDAERLRGVVWSELQLDKIQQPFQLPQATGSYSSVSHFVETEIMLQTEIMRSNLDHRLHLVRGTPKDATAHRNAEKHLRITLSSNVRGRRLEIDMCSIQKEPARGVFTNYVFVFQKRSSHSDEMVNICLAYCTQLRKSGAVFELGRDAEERSSDLRAGNVIYARPLQNCNMWKTHIGAIVAMKEAEAGLRGSFVCGQLMNGRIDRGDIKSTEELDAWIDSKYAGHSVSLELLNVQQQRALALEALTSRGLVLVQGPPGTGKSHTICHGFLPQAVSRNERVLVICNSNNAVDSLLMKCLNDEVSGLRGKMKRCGFKKSVSDDVVERGVYVEGDVSSIHDVYGNTSGANSNTADGTVQMQIRSAQVVFTTIHFASKEKGNSANNEGYWRFNTLVLDEAAQIEDAKLMIVLARCPSLRKIILVGDPKQLQPYVSDSLREQNYGRSTMERVMDLSLNAHVMLEEQFRMAPPLRSLVSHLYYDDRLKDDKCVLANGPVTKGDLKPLLVINCTGTSMVYSRMHHSYENRAEAEVVKVVYDFLFSSDFGDVLPLGGQGLTGRDACILTPYNRHKDILRMKVCGVEEDALDSYSGQTFSSVKSTPQKTPARNWGDTNRSRYSNTPLASPLKKSQAIYGTQDEVDEETAARVENIDTVDKFQGSERNVVMISTCVHDKPRRAADPHFINVACSRAKHLLVVVGNFTVGLAGNSDWQYVRSQAVKNGSYIDHRVTKTRGGNHHDDDAVEDDINEESLVDKLRELVQSPKKKMKREC